MAPSTTAPIEHAVQVPAPPARTFYAFAREFGQWWPPAYTWSGERLRHITIEPFEGGRCVEIGPRRFIISWGRVTEWAPPAQLAFTWQISADRQPVPAPENASLVIVRFTVGEEGTKVALTHRAFERHGGDVKAYRDALASPDGWPYILAQFSAYLAGRGDGRT